ncbi:hypothetical protein OQA88_10730 [Cercophora sp. LCS_1]
MLIPFAFLAALACPTTAAKISVSIGSLEFTPDTVTAAIGDIVEFNFFPVNNSVILSDFNTPCAPAKTGGFNSGFFATSSGQNPSAFQIVVNTTDPMFVYCGFPLHCKNGMSAVINPGKGQTLEAYRIASAKVDAVVPNGVFGGQIVASSGNTPPPGKSDASSPSGVISLGVPVAVALAAAAMML